MTSKHMKSCPVSIVAGKRKSMWNWWGYGKELSRLLENKSAHSLKQEFLSRNYPQKFCKDQNEEQVSSTISLWYWDLRQGSTNPVWISGWPQTWDPPASLSQVAEIYRISDTNKGTYNTEYTLKARKQRDGLENRKQRESPELPSHTTEGTSTRDSMSQAFTMGAEADWKASEFPNFLPSTADTQPFPNLWRD